MEMILSFPPVRGVHPSLTLKVAVVHPYDDHDDALFGSLVDDEIARDTDTGHAQFAAYVMSKMVSHLNDVSWFWASVRSTIQTMPTLKPIFKTLVLLFHSSPGILEHCVPAP
ncbi:hypothetical protein EDB19DRAFT_1912786 [Suillus lakei]|nr:hypothetical protein EDB19DRAFT_1912786 [Suillus lakei]